MVERSGKTTADAAKEARHGRGASSNSLTKMLRILDLFSIERPIWSANDLIEALGISRSMGYRYIKALNSAGLLGAVGNGDYVLGPRIIEMDLQIRSTDPLLQAGKGVLEQLAEASGHSALLCMLFKNSVLCIREHLAPLSPEHIFSRGQRRSLFRGAISRIILAHLPSHQMRSLYARNQAEIEAAGLGQSWDEFRTGLARIRKEGYAVSKGEAHPGVVGIAAPVFNSKGLILGSVGIAFGEEYAPNVDMNRLVIVVRRAGKEITQKTRSTIPGMDQPPRAVG